MNALLMQSPIQAIGDYFARGGDLNEFLVILGVLLVLLCGLVFVQFYLRKHRGRQPDDPRKLFRWVVRRLHLGVIERDLLRRMVAELRLQHPTNLLLSYDLFRDHALRYHAQCRKASGGRADAQAKTLDALSHTLFDRPLR